MRAGRAESGGGRANLYAGFCPRTGHPVRVATIHLGRALPHASSGLPGSSGGQPSNASCLTLLRVGFTEPPPSPEVLVVSYTTVSPLPRCDRRPVRETAPPRRSVLCGTVPRVTPGGRYPPPCPAEPGRSSASPSSGTRRGRPAGSSALSAYALAAPEGAPSSADGSEPHRARRHVRLVQPDPHGRAQPQVAVARRQSRRGPAAARCPRPGCRRCSRCRLGAARQVDDHGVELLPQATSSTAPRPGRASRARAHRPAGPRRASRSGSPGSAW